MLTRVLIAAACAAPCLAFGQGRFTDAERKGIVDTWLAPGRYTVGAPKSASESGPWQVRLTVAASKWFWNYQRATGAGKLPPSQDPVVPTPGWEDWIKAKLAYDRAACQAIADAANAALKGAAAPSAPALPPAPGPVPADMLKAMGNPPAFASVVAPLQHTIVFAGGDTYSFADNVPMRQRFAYYRSEQGVMDAGAPLRNVPRAELGALFEAAGMNPTEQHVFQAVSPLEGGFDAINTYDTGYISIGFIQFISGEEGNRSLLEVLTRHRKDAPEDFARTFHAFGIDATDDGVLVVVDPATGAELVGAEAVRRVIEDKRLIAVFQRAGRRSREFRIAQVHIAKDHYWAGDDPFTIEIDGQTITGKVSDVVRSEAGLATLFDRKVNRGSISPFADELKKAMVKRGIKDLAGAAACEREVIAACKYRHDFLADKSLTQP